MRLFFLAVDLALWFGFIAALDQAITAGGHLLNTWWTAAVVAMGVLISLNSFVDGYIRGRLFGVRPC